MAFALADIVREHGAGRPADVAIVCGEARLTWGKLDARSSRVANALLDAGAEPGDRIAVLARNCAEFFEIAFGAAKIGAATVGLNWRLAPPELAAVLADAEPRLLILDPEFEVLLATEPSSADPSSSSPASPPRLRLGPDYERWRDAAAATDPRHAVDPDSLAFLLYSSGTTGRPKGVMLTHANLAPSRRMAAEAFRMDGESVHMVASPQFHIGGAGTGLMTMFLGGRTVIMREASAATLLATIAGERVTHAFLVPAVIKTLLDALAAEGGDVTSLEQISYGAAPMTEALLRRAMAALGCDFLGVYGMTESAGTVTVLDPRDHHTEGPRTGLLRSVGGPLPWIELRVRALDGDAPAAVGEVGEIEVRGAQVTLGYWRQPETTAAALGGDGWLRTGDGAYRDAEGFVFLKDRIKDMIISGGENVYPAEVENALADHPDVADVAVIGVAHERWGETVVAVVVPAPGAAPDADALRAFARTRLAAYKCPTSVDFVAELPRNPSGKVLKKVLREGQLSFFDTSVDN